MIKAVIHFKNILIACLLVLSNISFAEEITVSASNDIDVTVETYPAKGEYLIIWLAPEYGFRKGHILFAKSLSEVGIEVWQANILEALFKPQGTGPLKELDGQYVADIIEYAHATSGKKIIVAGDSYGSLPALTGAYRWQQRNIKNPYLVGAILFSPYTYAYIPPLGLPPEFMPIVHSTNIPLLIYQAKDSGTIGQFEIFLEKIQSNGSPVYTRFFPDVMSLFYKEQPSEEMLKNAKPLPMNIVKMLPILEKHRLPEKPVSLKSDIKYFSGIDIYLKKFKGDSNPVAINLNDVHGKAVIRKDFTKQVTLVNFWATWCPPCVEEIPSLNRLKNKMSGLPFELISINYAENETEILEFMKQVNVEFPVLLDQNGEYAKQWNVITYPSTFVIDTEGKIRYGVNSAIEWDTPEVVDKIKSLLKK